MKKIISVVLSLVILLCFVPSFTGSAETAKITVGGTDDGSGNWYATLGEAAKTLAAGGDYEINVVESTVESESIVLDKEMKVKIIRDNDAVYVSRAYDFTGDLMVVSSNANVTLDNFFINGNNVVGSGKLINASNATLYIIATSLYYNLGGAIYIDKGAVVTMEQGMIYECGSETTYCGGVHIVDGTFNMISGNIYGCKGIYGGAVNVHGGTSVATLGKGSVNSNMAQYGAGVYVDRGTLNIDGTLFEYNTATMYGGAICNCGVSYMLYQKDGITGVVNYNSGEISNNFAKYGSGVYLNCESYVSKPGSVFASPNLAVSHKLVIAAGAVIDDSNDVYLAQRDMNPCTGDEGAYITVNGIPTQPVARITPAVYSDGLKVLEGADNVTVTPEDDSHEYKVVNGLLVITEKKFIPGDADMSGNVTVVDALMTLRVAAKLAAADGMVFTIMDMDKDNIITIADALAVLRISVGLA